MIRCFLRGGRRYGHSNHHSCSISTIIRVYHSNGVRVGGSWIHNRSKQQQQQPYPNHRYSNGCKYYHSSTFTKLSQDVDSAAEDDWTRPSERFDPTKDESEWQQITDDILNEEKKPFPLSPEDIFQIEESIRYWTVLVKRLYDIYDDKLNAKSSTNNEKKRKIHEKCAFIVDQAQRAYVRISLAIQKFPTLLESDDLKYWVDGKYPRSIHLLNPLLDAWKRTWVHHGMELNHYDGAELPLVLSPNQLYTYLTENLGTTDASKESVEIVPTLKLPFNCQSYTILMNASIQDPKEKQHAPDFCAQLLNDMMRISEEENDADTDIPMDENTKYNNEDEIKIKKMVSTKYVDSFPDTLAYTTAINAWAKSGRPDAGKHAEELLNEMIRMAELRRTDMCRPNSVTYNTVLEAYVSEQQTQPMIRAEELLYEMVSVPYPDVRPDTFSFRTVVFGWANLSTATLPQDKIDERYSNVQRAYKVLQDGISSMLTSGNTKIRIDSDFFSKLISQLTRGPDLKRFAEGSDTPIVRQYDMIKSLDFAGKIHEDLEKLLEQTQNKLFEPQTHTFRAMITVYCETRRPDMAYKILRKMEENAARERNSELLPGTVHYRDVFDALEEERVRTRGPPGPMAEKMMDMTVRIIQNAINTNDPSQTPNKVHVINRIFNMLAEACDPMKAEEFFYMLLSSYKESSFQELKPSKIDFQRVMKIWLSRSDYEKIAPDKIQALLFVMQELGQDDLDFAPDTFHFTILIDAWAKSRRDGADKKCLEILNLIRKTYAMDKSNRSMQPDPPLYGAVLQVLVRDGNGLVASQLLKVIERDYNEGNDKAIVSRNMCNAALLAWCRSKDHRAAVHALEIYRKMEEWNCIPSEVTYSRLLDILSEAPAKTKEINEYIRHCEAQLRKFGIDPRAPRRSHTR